MKKLIYTFLALSALAFSACSDDDKLPDVRPADRGTVTDDQGNVYNWVRIGNQMWTTSNALNGCSLADAKYYNNFDWVYVLSGERYIDDEDTEYYTDTYLPEYGNPMTYEEAVASAPDGWRLPSDEDWQQLERTLGMKNTDSKGFCGDGVATVMISEDSGCELGLQLGGCCVPVKTYGWIDMTLDYTGEHGYYWTSTVDESYDLEQTMVYFRRVTANYGKVARECIRSDCYMSVRWVKDVE